jgi:tRNA pseudouridine38-40 synthase
MTHYFKITIEYDGTPYVGWQAQDNGHSVQAAIEAAIFKFSGEHVRLTAAGRTDAGVHALGQVANFPLAMDITALKVREALNSTLRNEAVAVVEAEEVDENFSARFSATKRHYIYKIVNRRAPLVLRKNRAWHVPQPLDADAMHEAAQVLLGEHDFTTFRAVLCQAKSPVKTLDQVDVERVGDEVHIHVSARSFLHHQVRSIVGCLKLVGTGKWTKADLKSALDAVNRQRLGFNAPPDGLYLRKVDFK